MEAYDSISKLYSERATNDKGDPNAQKKWMTLSKKASNKVEKWGHAVLQHMAE
jgi:hypothetical protein